jgi:RNA polymerase sigma-70 factor (ECF subfamily)
VEIATDEMNINAQFNKEQLSKLNMALSNLKVKDREIIYYYFYENFGYKKIAEIMDYNHVSSARRAVYKVLRRLKKLMIVVTLVIHSL